MKNFLIGFFLTISAILFPAILMSGCSTATGPAEAYPDETPQQIFANGKESLQDKNFSEAVKRFEALDVQYPYGQLTETAQLYLIYAYYMKEEYALSVVTADRFIRLHPTNPHLDYAYYLRGIANYHQNLGFIERIFTINLATRDLTQIQKSYRDFNELLIRFPRSPYAASAHQYMVYLRNVLANHDLQVAQFYYQRKAYVAAVNRASEVILHYQGAPAVKEALILQVKAYHQLKLNKLESDAMKVLQYNYSDVSVHFE